MLSKKQIEKKYNCTVNLNYFDGFKFYQAYPNDKKHSEFESASGWSLSELVADIEDNLLI